MANIYTKDDTSLSDQIFFLNGGNLTHDIGTENGLNPIPSLKLLNQVNKDINDRIDVLSGDVQNLSVDNVISEGDIITSLSQKNGKISYEKTKLLSSHVEGLSDFVEKKIEDISYNVENSGNGIISTLSQRNGKVEVSFKQIVSSDVVGLSEYVAAEIDKLDSEKHSEDKKFITGIKQENGVVSEISSRQLSSSDIFDLNNTIDAKINALDVNVISSVNKVIYAVSENDGKIDANFRNITESDFGTNMISQSKISNLVRDLGNISSEYLLKNEFKSRLSDAFDYTEIKKDFRYDSTSKQFILDVCGKVMTIELSSVIGSKIITKVEVIDVGGGEKVLRIHFDTGAGSTDFVDIRMSSLVQVYKAGDGITIDDSLSINVNSTIARQSSITEMTCNYNEPDNLITSITQTNGKITVGSSKLSTSHVAGLAEALNESISEISGTKVITDGQILTSITQSNGKITETGTRKLSVLDIDGLTSDLGFISSHFVRNDIDGVINANLGVNHLSSDRFEVYQRDEDDNYAYLSVGAFGLAFDSEGEKRKITLKLDEGINSISVNGYSLCSYIESGVGDAKKYVDGVSASLNESLAINVELSSSSPSKFVSSYYITQGGNKKGCSINIPKTEYNGGKTETISVSVENYTICADILDDAIKSKHISATLSTDYNLSGNLSALAYKECLSSTEICGMSDYVKCTDNLSTINNNEISAYGKKVFIDDQVSGNQDAVDLSIIKLPLSSYELSVIAGSLISSNLYVLDSDYIDAFGQQICSLTMGEGDKAYEGMAVTDTYVDEKITRNINKLKEFGSEISSRIIDRPKGEVGLEDMIIILSSLVEHIMNMN